MSDNHIEAMARAAYDDYFAGLIGCCEPTFDALDEDHRARMIASMNAGLLALAKSIREHGLPMAATLAYFSSPRNRPQGDAIADLIEAIAEEDRTDG